MQDYNISPRLIIYDSTLRDGEQMPGVTFTPEEKLTIARALDALGVPEIDVGFPAVSAREREAIKLITRERLDAKILVLTRASRADIDLALECDADTAMVFVPASDIHLKYKLNCTREDIRGYVMDSIEYANAHGINVTFSTEDSTRTPLTFLEELYAIAIERGVRRIGLTDTLGCISPDGMSYLVRTLKRKFGTVPLSIHCHNDFGLALANALAGVQAGADAVTVTVNGIGERAGNVALDEFVVAMKLFYNRDLGINLSGLTVISKLVEQLSGIPIAKNKPWVGPNAFAHESGIHVGAILNKPYTYECIPPAIVGNMRKFTLGKHSGIKSISYMLQRTIGIQEVSVDKLQQILEEVKLRSEQKHRVDETEFKRIVEQIIS
jgi:methanogen homocitrate synthase